MGLGIFLSYALFFGYRAAGHRHVANRQETSFGLVAECKNSGKGANYCHYTFSTEDGQYRGVSQAGSDVVLGQTVTVYYDSQNPALNSLEDFSEMSRTEENWLYVYLSLSIGVVVFIFFSKGRTPRAPG